MTVGFHYHIPIEKSADGSLRTQSFYGLFLDSIAPRFKALVVFSYTPTESELDDINYIIKSTNVHLVELGNHASVVRRISRFVGQYSLFKAKSAEIDVLLVRAPTPLVLLLYFLKRRFRIVLFLVGSYVEGAKDLKFGVLKNLLIRILAHGVELSQRRIIMGNTFLANSIPLLQQYTNYAKSGHLIRTTTLSSGDFYRRTKLFANPSLRLLYTGRLDESKGLFEIVEACKLLAREISIEFHFAGLIVKGKEDLPERLLQLAASSPLEGRVFYHGLKRVGDELNQLYRSCDVFIVGSKSNFEGFPRTIWEAMANSLPVIASPMGSIPYFLQDARDAVFLKAVSAEEIFKEVMRLSENKQLCEELIARGFELARQNTLEMQAEKLKSVLENPRNEQG